jgi:hypothetical protein
VRWNIIAMGLMPSLYCAVQIMSWMEETVFGDHLDQDNVFRWNVVEWNLCVFQDTVLQHPGFTRNDLVMEESRLMF